VTASAGSNATRELRSVRATRYVTALREGGSLPGLVEADDDGLYVVKFRGAGQGARVLAAEWLAGEIGRAIGLLVPDLVAVDLDAGIADSEPPGDPRSAGGVGRKEHRPRLPAWLDDVQPPRRCQAGP